MKRTVLLLAVALLLSCLPQAFSQDAQAKKSIQAALAKLAGKDVGLTGKVSEEAELPDNSAVGGAAGGVVRRVVVTSMGGGIATEDFYGEMDVVRQSTGDLNVLSKTELPAIKVFKSGEDVLCMQTHTDQPHGVSNLTDNLTHMFDWSLLSKAVEESEKVRVTPYGKDTEVRVVLNNDYIPAPSIEKQLAGKLGNKAGIPGAIAGGLGGGIVGGGGGNVRVQIGGGPMGPSIVDLTATFLLSDAGDLKEIEFALQYDDPMKAMMAKAMRGGGAAGAAILQLQGNAAKKPGEDTELGKLINFEFKVTPTPSQQAVQFGEQARKLLSNRK